ncbi:MAG TPA: hypothetical protein VE591_13975, partial [Candidatus Acidoferrum sp.]|nr:hypothetical protein [Candidatus Acidoferrum sp.]
VVFMPLGDGPVTAAALVGAVLAGKPGSNPASPLSDPRGLVGALAVLASGEGLVLAPRVPAGVVP